MPRRDLVKRRGFFFQGEANEDRHRINAESPAIAEV
jgi:hypothetical protein